MRIDLTTISGPLLRSCDLRISMDQSNEMLPLKNVGDKAKTYNTDFILRSFICTINQLINKSKTFLEMTLLDI